MSGALLGKTSLGRSDRAAVRDAALSPCNEAARQSVLEQQPFLSLTIPWGGGTQPGGAVTVWGWLDPEVSWEKALL